MAQSPAGTEAAPTRQDLERLFEQILRDPANAELTLRYASVATKLGDFEAAITALERLLFFNPSLAQVRLELGVLYYRLGSYGLARDYLEQAKGANAVPPEAAALVDRYLADITKRESQQRVSVQVATGMIVESNANLGPASGDVKVAGLPNGIGTLSSQFTKKKDQSLFASGTGVYTYDLQDQDRSSVEVTAQTFFSKHFRVRSLDLSYLEGTVGPRSSLTSYGLEGYSGRVYGIADYARLGGAPLFHAFGVGLDVSKTLLDTLQVRGVYEFRAKNYYDIVQRPTVTDLAGTDSSVTAQVQWAPTGNQMLTASATFTDQSARAQYQTNRQYGVSVGYQVAYRPPVEFDAGFGPWQSSFTLGRSLYNYTAPDPRIDPDTRRADRRWRFSAIETIPLLENLSLSVQFQRDVISSTIPNFAYQNTSFVFGPQLRF